MRRGDRRGALSQDLLDDLLTFRVETFVLEAAADNQMGANRAPARVPPVEPDRLIEEVARAAIAVVDPTVSAASGPEANVSSDERSGASPPPAGINSGILRTLAHQAQDMAEQPTTQASPAVGEVGSPGSRRGVDPDIAIRSAEALELVASLVDSTTYGRVAAARLPAATARAHATGDMGLGQPQGVAEAEAPLAAGGLREHEVVARDMRQLARLWELSDRTVWCRTTMGLDGDVATVLRAHGTATSSLERAHMRMVEVAMDHWLLLITMIGAAVQLVGGAMLRPAKGITDRTLIRSLSDVRRHLEEKDAEQRRRPIGLRQLAYRLWRLFVIGRVVFVSPTASNVEVRTVLHPSGDIETSVRSASISDAVLEEHTTLVTGWLIDLARGIERARWSVLAASAVLAAVVAAGSAVWWVKHESPVRLIVTLVTWPLLAWAIRGGFRLWLRRKILRIVGPTPDGVEVG